MLLTLAYCDINRSVATFRFLRESNMTSVWSNSDTILNWSFSNHCFRVSVTISPYFNNSLVTLFIMCNPPVSEYAIPNGFILKYAQKIFIPFLPESLC